MHARDSPTANRTRRRSRGAAAIDDDGDEAARPAKKLQTLVISASGVDPAGRTALRAAAAAVARAGGGRARFGTVVSVRGAFRLPFASPPLRCPLATASLRRGAGVVVASTRLIRRRRAARHASAPRSRRRTPRKIKRRAARQSDAPRRPSDD